MDRKREWFDDTTFKDKVVTFPDQSVWRLKKCLAQKAHFPDEGPSEASAVFDCEKVKGPKVPASAVVRLRMQYASSHCYCYSSQVTDTWIESPAPENKITQMQDNALNTQRTSLQISQSGKLKCSAASQKPSASIPQNCCPYYAQSKMTQCGFPEAGSYTS